MKSVENDAHEVLKLDYHVHGGKFSVPRFQCLQLLDRGQVVHGLRLQHELREGDERLCRLQA